MKPLPPKTWYLTRKGALRLARCAFVLACVHTFGLFRAPAPPVTHPLSATTIAAAGGITNNQTNATLGGVYFNGLAISNLPVSMSYKAAFSHAYTGQSAASGYSGSGHNGTGQVTYRLKHFCTTTVGNLRLMFGNSAGAAIGANDIFVKAGVENSAGKIYPVSFQGQRTVVIPPGTFVYSDPLATVISAGDFIWSRTCVSAGGAGTWAEGQVHQLTGEGQSDGDLADSGSISQNLGYSYCPFAIFGETAPWKSSIAIIGDSIAMGYDVSNPYDAAIVMGLGANFGANWSHTLLGLDGDSFANFVNQTNRLYRMKLLEGCTVVLCELGINDSGGTLASMTNNAITTWTLFKRMGLKVYQTTLTPYTTSSAGFSFTNATTYVTDQTPVGQEAVRTQFNNIVRAGGYGYLDGYVDAEALAGTNSAGSIVWKPFYSGDGLHPKGSVTNTAIWQCLTNLTNNLF